MIFAGSRHFLFLQGPPGPFFADLAAALAAAGHRCTRINLNGGDWIDWRADAHDFTGDATDWPSYLARLLDRAAVSDIVLFGDCRPAHRAACALAQRLGIVVHVFEEGYIRPDWITLERGGVNGHSSLPRHPDQFLALAAGLPPILPYPPLRASFARRAVEAMRYYLACWLLALRYAGYRSHRPYPILVEALGWTGRLLARPIARRRSAAAVRKLAATPYFLMPLQLDSDHQIRTHSPFAGMGQAIEAVIASFAAHAPADHALLVKEHPLDNGLRAWRRRVRRTAIRHRVGARVVFVEHGDIETLVGGAIGLVTVNSTTGTLALAAGIPVAVLGRAVYDLPGVTHQGNLDAFWHAPGRPQSELYEAFRRVLVARCLLRGGFSSKAGRAALLPAAIERLSRGQLGSQAGATMRDPKAAAC